MSLEWKMEWLHYKGSPVQTHFLFPSSYRRTRASGSLCTWNDTILCLHWYFVDYLKTFWKHVGDALKTFERDLKTFWKLSRLETFWRHFRDVLEMIWKHFENILEIFTRLETFYLERLLETFRRLFWDFLKTLWRVFRETLEIL